METFQQGNGERNTVKVVCCVRRGEHVPAHVVGRFLPYPNWECCNGMTQTDGNVCRWLADHRQGDPVRGRAGEGEQVARCPATVRRARCA